MPMQIWTAPPLPRSRPRHRIQVQCVHISPTASRCRLRTARANAQRLFFRNSSPPEPFNKDGERS